MINLATLIFIAGILHLGTLLGSYQVPRELRFSDELPKLNPLLRHWVLVAGGYIVFNIVAFGLISLLMSESLASGSPLARAVCAYIALFWLARLLIQLFVFDARPYLRNLFLKIGYHGLTVVFTWHVVVFGWAALRDL